jgi:hypothetical protein
MFVPISYEVTETQFGIRCAAIREAESNNKSIQVSHFVMPFLGCNPVGKMKDGKVDGALVVYQAPADDYHTWRYHLRFRRSEPLLEEEMVFDRTQVRSDHRLKQKKEAGYFIVDREKQRKVNFTGLEGFAAQDSAVIEGMGPISDRTKEHLGFGDAYVIALRRFLLKAVKSFQQGIDPPAVNKQDNSEILCWSGFLPTGER